jgi:hypothetical protein
MITVLPLSKEKMTCLKKEKRLRKCSRFISETGTEEEEEEAVAAAEVPV